MYDSDRAVPKSHVAAYALYDASARQDDSASNNAGKNSKSIAKSMTAAQIKRGQALSRTLLESDDFNDAMKRINAEAKQSTTR